MGIVLRAATEGITDLGQLTRAQRAALKNAVRRGTLSKTTDCTYPTPKTRYIARLPWEPAPH